MKSLFGLLLLTLAGCVSSGPVEIGMSKRAWRKAEPDAQLVNSSGSGQEVWQSGDTYYIFRDGKLSRISGGTQQVSMTVDPMQ